MIRHIKSPEQYVSAIKNSGLTIYDEIDIGDDTHWIPTPVLELLLGRGLVGKALANLPLRTRSKIVKEFICKALGYPVPSTFKKTQPRFPGQNFDVYNQKSNNLQVWNEELSPARRYVIVRISENDLISKVKVFYGNSLARLDLTGTLTQKYQARFTVGESRNELITELDTDRLRPYVTSSRSLGQHNPTANPKNGELLSIRSIFERLAPLVGTRFPDKGRDQERNRGGDLHRLVCQTLGYKNYQDNGQFPDIRHQLLEVKLQTSPTIDLGLVLPNSVETFDVPAIDDQQVRHCDVRYAVYYGVSLNGEILLTNFYLTNGESFFVRFPQFQGRVINRKLQIPLPSGFFDS